MNDALQTTPPCLLALGIAGFFFTVVLGAIGLNWISNKVTKPKDTKDED